MIPEGVCEGEERPGGGGWIMLQPLCSCTCQHLGSLEYSGSRTFLPSGQPAQMRLIWPRGWGSPKGLLLRAPGELQAQGRRRCLLGPQLCPPGLAESSAPSQRGPVNFSCSAELLQRYQHMVNLPSVQKCRVICPNGGFCIFILMSVFKAYETGNC